MKNVAYLFIALSLIVSCAQPLVSPNAALGTGTATITIPTQAPWLTRAEKLMGIVAALKGQPAVTPSSAAVEFTSAASRAFLQASKVVVHVQVQENGAWSDLAVAGNPYLLSSLSSDQNSFTGQDYLTGTISGVPADVGYRFVAEVYANSSDSLPTVVGVADDVEISQFMNSKISLKCLPRTTVAVDFNRLETGQTSVSLDVPRMDSGEAWIKAVLIGGRTYSISTDEPEMEALFFAFDETGSYRETLYGYEPSFTPQYSGTYYLGLRWGMEAVVATPAAELVAAARSELAAPETTTVTLTSVPARQVLKGTIAVPEFLTNVPWVVMALPIDITEVKESKKNKIPLGLISGISQGSRVDYQFQNLPAGTYAVFAVLDSGFSTEAPEELLQGFLYSFLGSEMAIPGLYLAGGKYRSFLEVGKDFMGNGESGFSSFLEKLSVPVSEDGVTTHNLVAFPVTVNSAELPVTHGDPEAWTAGSLNLGVDVVTGASVAHYITPVVPRATYTVSWQNAFDGSPRYLAGEPVVVSALAETSDGTLRTLFSQKIAGYGLEHEPWVVQAGPSDKSFWLIVEVAEMRRVPIEIIRPRQVATSRIPDSIPADFAIRIDEGTILPWVDPVLEKTKREDPSLDDQ